MRLWTKIIIFILLLILGILLMIISLGIIGGCILTIAILFAFWTLIDPFAEYMMERGNRKI
jgi:multisubunit Na+/H+ antiporter MnhG subunit